MSEPDPFASRPDLRTETRAPICAFAWLKSPGRAPSQHLSFDLSPGGIRLCGLPNASLGEEVEILLQLHRQRLRLPGCLQRIGSHDGKPDFALRFVEPTARARSVIEEVVRDVASPKAGPSLLLFDDTGPARWAGWDWLDHLRDRCARAESGLEAVELLESQPFEMGLVRRTRADCALPAWAEAYPELTWATIDAAGRLHPVSTTFGPGHYGP